MKKIDEILSEWDKDSEIDRTEPGRELIKIPKLHSKYLTIMSHYRQLVRASEFKISEMKKLKWQFYTGKMSQEDLEEQGWQPFPYVLKSDVSTYIEGDKDLNRLLAQKTMYQECVNVCEFILKELHSRTFQLKSFIEYERFIQGA
jgi:hypothetical protein